MGTITSTALSILAVSTGVIGVNYYLSNESHRVNSKSLIVYAQPYRTNISNTQTQKAAPSLNYDINSQQEINSQNNNQYENTDSTQASTNNDGSITYDLAPGNSFIGHYSGGSGASTSQPDQSLPPYMYNQNPSTNQHQTQSPLQQNNNNNSVNGGINPSIVNLTLNTTGQVEASYLNDSASIGAGFFVNYNGIDNEYILTDNHVVFNNDNPNDILNPQHINFTINNVVFNATVVKHDSQNDLALLKLDKPDTNVGSILDFSNESDTDLDVVTVGSPLGVYDKVSEGTSNGYRDINGRTFVEINASINPGNSGGPVVDQYGKIIGIIDLKIIQNNNPDGPGPGEATPTNVIESFLSN